MHRIPAQYVTLRPGDHLAVKTTSDAAWRHAIFVGTTSDGERMVNENDVVKSMRSFGGDDNIIWRLEYDASAVDVSDIRVDDIPSALEHSQAHLRKRLFYIPWSVTRCDT